MNKEKLQEILKTLNYHDEMAKQHITIVSDRDYLVEILEAILEEKEDRIKNQDKWYGAGWEDSKREIIGKVEKIMRDTLSADTDKYHREVSKMYEELDLLLGKMSDKEKNYYKEI